MRELDRQAPLIVIGAGRSGSTLLMRVLQRHPDMSFHGETSFLVPRIWKECYENRFWHNWERYYRMGPGSALERLPELGPGEAQQLERRVGAAVARLVSDLLDVDQTAKAWGYKELWNGGRVVDHDWTIYDAVFPRATLVHLVRNPILFARSAAHWNGYPLDESRLVTLLEDWVGLVRKARQRASTGRYVEVRYEDMIADGRGALTPILKAAGLDWHPDCGAPFDAAVFTSTAPAYRKPAVLQSVLTDFGARVNGLADLTSELAYESVPITIDLQPLDAYPTLTQL